MKHDMTSEQFETLTQHISAIGSDVKDLKSSFETHFKEDAEWKKNTELSIKDVQFSVSEELANATKEERKTSDKIYAIKLAERVIFGLVAMLCIAAIVAILKTINL